MQHEMRNLRESVLRRVSITTEDHPRALRKTRLEKEMTLWDRWVDEESPDVFGFLELARDGGFSGVRDLYDGSRWLTTAILLLFLVYNVTSLIIQDLQLIFSPRSCAQILGATVDALDRFYFSENFIKFIAPMLGFRNIPLPVQVIGALELTGLVYCLFELVVCSIRATAGRGFRRWLAVYTLFWFTLPYLSVYSAMRLLYNFVPTVLASRVSLFVGEVLHAKRKGKPLAPHIRRICFWLLLMIFGFIIGFDAFLMKLRIVFTRANNKILQLSDVLPCLQFLIQVTGVVQLGNFVRDRLFRFIFGGEDGILQEEEIIRMETWNALLCKRIYNELSFLQFFVVMCSFSDEDFQSLVMNEHDCPHKPGSMWSKASCEASVVGTTFI